MFVYTALAPRMAKADEQRVLEEIAREEARHRDYFAERLRAVTTADVRPSLERTLADPTPSLQARGFVTLARVLGPHLVLALLRVAEGREVARFLREVSDVSAGVRLRTRRSPRSRAKPPSTRSVWATSPGCGAIPGIAQRPAAWCGASSTASTMASPPTSA